MPNKVFEIDNNLSVTVYKRRSSRNLRLSVASDGSVRVSIPVWASYQVGLEFAKARAGWIRDQARAPRLLANGQAVGKAHRLALVPVKGITKPVTRVAGSTVTIRYPAQLNVADPIIQKAANLAGERALRLQAERLLPQRLATLANKHGFEYADVRVKRLKSRWGSCDHKRQIVLNLFLMQLPWELIDYVLLHELTHTKVLRHGPDFWRMMEEVLPASKQLRKQLRTHHPILTGLA